MFDIEVNYIVRGAEEGANKVEELNESVEQTGVSAKRSIVSIVGLAASVSSLYFQFDNLDKIQLRITKNQRVMEEQQAKVNKLQKEGKEKTKEYAFESRQLVEMQEKLRQSQSDVTQSQVGFLFNLVGVVAQIPTAVTSILSLAGGHATATLATKAHTLATSAHTIATRANTLASLFNPWTAAVTIAAAAAAIALLATNTFGLRDAVFGHTKALQENTKASTGNSKAIIGITDAYGDYSEEVENQKGIWADSTTIMDAYTAGISRQSKALLTVSDKLRIYKDKLKEVFGELTKFQELKILQTLGEIPTFDPKKKSKNIEESKERANRERLIQIAQDDIDQGFWYSAYLLMERELPGAIAAKDERAVAKMKAVMANARSGRNISGTLKSFSQQTFEGQLKTGAKISQMRAAAQKHGSNFAKASGVKRSGGHSRFRRDRPGGRWRAFLAFTLPGILTQSGLDEETAHRLAQMATIGQGSSADRSRRAIPYSFNQTLFNQLVTEELATRKRLAYEASPEYFDSLNQQEHLKRMQAMSTGTVN